MLDRIMVLVVCTSSH